MQDSSNRYVIYSDGSCLDNPGYGGWAVLIISDGAEQIIAGHEPGITTNNVCELRAAIKGLEALPVGSSAILYSDSKYVVQGMTQWLATWKIRGWLTYDKKPVKNKELWVHLDALNSDRSVTYEWLKGHAGNVFNERVDSLANAEAVKASQSIQAHSYA